MSSVQQAIKVLKFGNYKCTGKKADWSQHLTHEKGSYEREYERDIRRQKSKSLYMVKD
jgi:hypothetical protein